MKLVAVSLIRFYQFTWSRVMPHACIFMPTCSQYGREAMNKYGFLKGGWLTLKRLIRCNPFNEGRYDPVP